MNLFFKMSNMHDAAVCFIRAGQLHYLKIERFLQKKHFGAQDQMYTHFVNNFHKLLGDEFKFIDHRWKTSHHYRHALSVDFFEETPCDVHIVIDGSGDEKWFSVYRQGKLIDSAHIMDTGGSLGHGLSHMACSVGMRNTNNLDRPGKVMGLQSYGKLDYAWYEKLQKYNMYHIGEKDTTNLTSFIQNQNHLFSISHELSHEAKLDLLHTIHHRAGEIVVDIFKKHVKPNEKVGYSGGVAQNVIWNTELKKQYPNLVIYPHSSDEGQIIGVFEYFRQENHLPKNLFKFKNFPYSQSDESPSSEISQDSIYKVAKKLAEGKIVAWYQGHGEVGPRALGHRSILLDPRLPDGKNIINSVKNREYYRPFGASVLEEDAKEYFDLDFPNPFMLYLGNVQKSNLPAITHVDNTCRAQTVAKSSHCFRKLLETFFDLTGCPVLLNTSLNQSGKPIAGWIKNAVNEFHNKPIDVLSVGDEIFEK